MAIQRMDHSVNGLDDVRVDIAMMRTLLCYLRGPAGIIVALAEQLKP